MGRGKHLSTKKKEMRGLMEAMMVGISKGELAASKKKYSLKNLPHILLSKFDEMKSDQIFKFVSIFGVALLIKGGIDWTQVAVSEIWEIFAHPLIPFPFGGIVTKAGEELEGEPNTEVLEWILSFTLAYLIVENFGDVVTAGGSVLSLGKTLLLGMV